MYLFELNDVEQKRANEVALKHQKECILSNFAYTFYPGSIGTSKRMICTQCEKWFDITDLDSF